MKKLIATVIAVIVVCALCAGFAGAVELERCRFCGEENAFIQYTDTYGRCTKCGADTLRYNLTIKVKSSGDKDGLVEAKLYQHGKLIKLYEMYGNNDETTMHSVQHGMYTLVVTKAGHTMYTRIIRLNRDMTVSARLYPVHMWWRVCEK